MQAYYNVLHVIMYGGPILYGGPGFKKSAQYFSMYAVAVYLLTATIQLHDV